MPGVYTAHAALELYAEVFDEEGSLDKLERFASFNGPDFYRLPRNSSTVILEKVSHEIPTDMPLGSQRLIPLRAGERVQWTLTRQP